VHLLAAALRADREDICSLTTVLTETLAAALPPGIVETSHRRSLLDRLAGRAGHPVHVVVHGQGRDLHLRQDKIGTLTAESWQIIHGVVIRRRALSTSEWTEAVAEDLAALVAHDADTRNALAHLLGPR